MCTSVHLSAQKCVDLYTCLCARIRVQVDTGMCTDVYSVFKSVFRPGTCSFSKYLAYPYSENKVPVSVQKDLIRSASLNTGVGGSLALDKCSGRLGTKPTPVWKEVHVSTKVGPPS